MENLEFYNELSNICKEEEKSEKKIIHNEIEKDKESILNCYREEPVYKDTLDYMEMKSRGKFYYKSLVKNQINKKSNFLKMILNSISKIKDKDKKNVNDNRKRGYNLSKLESMRNYKYKIDKRLKLRENSDINIYNNKIKEKNNTNIFLISGKKCLESMDNIKKSKFPISLNKNKIFFGIKNNSGKDSSITTLKNNISRSLSLKSIYINNNNETNLNEEGKKIEKFNDILDKCRKEIKKGGIIGGKMEKFAKRFDKNLLKSKRKIENKVNNVIQDQKIIEEKIKTKQKYKLLEIEKFKELKRKLNVKISDNYAYFNRKKYSEIINEKRKDNEYDLYYEDMNKVYENILENKVKEKSKFNEIENLLENSYKKKNYLKNKISNYNKNKIILMENESKEKNNYDLIIKKEEEEKDDNIGTLVPALLKKKEDFIKNKKNKNYIAPF